MDDEAVLRLDFEAIHRKRDRRVLIVDTVIAVGGGIVGAAIGLVIVAMLTGCGGVPHAARLGAEQLAIGVDRADVIVANRITERSPEVIAQVLSEIASGSLPAADARARSDELLSGERGADLAIATARRASLAIEAALDAWDAGATENGFIGAAACVVVALAELAEAFVAAGLELPEAISDAARMLASFASGACPAPEAT